MGVIQTELLVIGGGLAGRRCAQEAGKSAEVLLIADGAGASPFIHGLNVPLLKEDSVDRYLKDTLDSGYRQNNTALCEILCQGSISLTKEFSFDRKENGEYVLIRPLGATWPRVASIGNQTGVSILNEIREHPRFSEMHHVRAMQLITENGRVAGAICFDTQKLEWFTIHSKAVVLACGGFGNIFRLSTNSSDIGGDGIAMACEAGAALCDMEFIQYEPTVAIYPEQVRGKGIITTMLYDGAVIRNGSGERFMDEKVNKDQLSYGIFREIKSGKCSPHKGVWYDMTGVPSEKIHGVYEAYYQRYRSVGIDITKEPVEIVPAPHTTMGGICIDTDMRTGVEGLFACGEVTGGIHGANRLGGNAGTEVLVLGKRAGEKAAEYLKNSHTQCSTSLVYTSRNYPTCQADTPWNDTELRERLWIVLDRALSVIRNQTDLEYGLREVRALIKQTKNCAFCFNKMRFYHDALTAEQVIMAALNRKESLGSHIREDT